MPIQPSWPWLPASQLTVVLVCPRAKIPGLINSSRPWSCHGLPSKICIAGLAAKTGAGCTGSCCQLCCGAASASGCGRVPKSGGVARNPPATLTGPAPANMSKVLEWPEVCRGAPASPHQRLEGSSNPHWNLRAVTPCSEFLCLGPQELHVTPTCC